MLSSIVIISSKNNIMTVFISLLAIILMRASDIFLFHQFHLIKHSLFLHSFFLKCTISPILSQRGLFYIILYGNSHSINKISLLLCKTFLYLQGLDSNLKIFLTAYFYGLKNSLNFLNFQINRIANRYQAFFQALVRRISRDSLLDLYAYFTFFLI